MVPLHSSLGNKSKTLSKKKKGKKEKDKQRLEFKFAWPPKPQQPLRPSYFLA